MLSGFLKKLGGGNGKDSTTSKSTTSTSTSGLDANPVNLKTQGIGVRTIGSSAKVLPKSLDKATIPTIAHKSTIEPKIDRPANTPNSIVKVEQNSKLKAILQNAITVLQTTAIEEEIATIFSEGEDQLAIETIKNYFKDKKGVVEQRIWFMLLDLNQILKDTQEFEKVALSFAQTFGTSPPSWFGNESTDNKKENLGGGKNMIILEPMMNPGYVDKFKELYKSAKQENFCRINVSQCKFEQNDPAILEKFLKLLIDLKKAKVVSVLMGDNNLVNFCKKFIEDANFRKTVNPGFNNNEQIVWLIYLEVLQWKGQHDEFENIALNFAEKFEVSPPGWDEKGIMDLNKVSKDMIEPAISSNKKIPNISLDKNLNINTVNTLLDFIKDSFDKEDFSEIDLSEVERIDFSSAGAISFHIQELWSNPSHSHKKVILINPNELIIVLLHMVGATEFVEIIPRNRK